MSPRTKPGIGLLAVGSVAAAWSRAPLAEIPVPPAVLPDLQIELRPRHRQAIDLDQIAAPECQEIDAGIERIDPRQRLAIAPICIGHTNVGGGDRHRRPGVQAEGLTERDLASGRRRGAALDRPFLQRRGDQQERGDGNDRHEQDQEQPEE